MTSTTMSSTAAAIAAARDHTMIPFERLVRTERRKLTDTRAGKWLLIGIFAITPIVAAVMLLASQPKDLTFQKFLDFSSTPLKLLLPAMGILTMTSEWSQRTGLVTFTLVPDRARVLRAKFVAAVTLGLGVIFVCFAASAVGALLGHSLRHTGDSWHLWAPAIGEITLILVTELVVGMAFGMALLVTPAAMVLYYVLPNLSSVLFTSSSGGKKIAPWFDLNEAQSPLYSHDVTGKGWVQLATACAIWVLLPLLIGVRRISRTEIKSS